MSEVIVLCGRAKCCPTFEKEDEDRYVIKDDFGGKVILNKENVIHLKKVVL